MTLAAVVVICCIQCVGAGNVAAAATNGFTSHSATTTTTAVVHSSSKSLSGRGVESHLSSHNTVPPTPPTRDRIRLDLHADHNGSRFFFLHLVGYLDFTHSCCCCWCSALYCCISKSM